MENSVIRISENELRCMITEAISKIMFEGVIRSGYLYHKSPISCRKSIMKGGLVPSVGDSYKAHWEDEENLKPYIFLYDHDSVRGGEYDSTYDDDIYRIDVSKLDKGHLHRDPDRSMRGCYVYDEVIPKNAIELVYKGSRKDSDEMLMMKHSNIYEEKGTNGIEFKEDRDEYGDINIGVYKDSELMGFIVILIHKSLYSLDSEISETDSYETAYKVIRALRDGSPIVELADVLVMKGYRNMGVSKMLLEYVLNKYNGYQFYLRVCPTDGVDEKTLANSVKKYGFLEVENTENGTFLIKR